jgi:hypothetical protein
VPIERMPGKSRVPGNRWGSARKLAEIRHRFPPSEGSGRTFDACRVRQIFFE